MSRRRSRELMAGFWEEFKDGAAARGVPEATAQRVFTQVIAFSEFGFPKSHAAAFGLLAYQSAWLRHYHPAEYYCALFNNQPMGFYSLDGLGGDAKRDGVEIRLPDVNESDVWCTVDLTPFPPLLAGEGGRNAVRVGLGFVRDWSEETATAVVLERERNGRYRSIGDFVRRAPPNLKRTAIEHLVWVGGCDGFGLTRRELLWQVGLVVARQRPETAKGFVFVLLDDVAGMVNVIVRPDVYDRYRATIRGEPLLWIAGKLAKDDGTVNVIAEEAQGLKVGTRNAERGTNSETDSSAVPLPHSAFAFLKSMRRVAPDSKDWG